MKHILFGSLVLISISCKTTISGQVLTPDGNAAYDKQGKINITRLDVTGFEEIVSMDEDGTFSSESDIQAGEYLVEPLIPGFQSNSKTIVVKEDTTIGFEAIPLPKKRSRAIEAHNSIEVDNGSGGAIITPPRL